MDLRHTVAAILRWRLLVALIALLGMGAGAAYAATTTAQYKSTSTVFFALDRSTSVTELAQGSTYTQDAVKSYSQLVTLPLVLAPVIKQLNLDVSVKALAKRVTVDAQPDTVIANITVVDPQPQVAARIANAVASQLATVVASLTPSARTSKTASIVVTTISQAQPASPRSSPVPLVVPVGLIIGAILGIALAIVLELITSPLVTAQSAAATAPILGRIAYDSKARNRPLPVITHPQLARAESFRAVRTNLRTLDGRASSQCLVVTSPLEGEGRTSVAVNLAIAISSSFQSVLLIDADLRHSTVAHTLGLDESIGLVDVLKGEAVLEDAVQSWTADTWGSPRLSVLPAGPRQLEPSELLALGVMTRLIDTVRHKYDVVILDSAPLLPVTDGALVAAQVDGALLVVKSGSTRERDLSEALSVLNLAGAKTSGIILNAAKIPKRKLYRPQKNR